MADLTGSRFDHNGLHIQINRTSGGADQINQAAEDSEKGITIKSIVRLVSPAG